MLQRARKRVRKSGAASYVLKRGDAYRLDYPDDCFDVLVNNYMFDLIPEHDNATRPPEKIISDVDSYRFLDTITRRLVKSWIKLEPQREIPWTPLSKPLAECTVALISTGGIALKTDRPFDQEGERRNPWWGDPSYRIIPNTARTGDIRVYHLHINPEAAESDMNCLLPIERLNDLVTSGTVGRAAPSHYSFMGYVLKPQELLEKSIPAMIDQMRAEKVDVVVMIPA
jgi:D-proline reductase (dithiol) PrdB